MSTQAFMRTQIGILAAGTLFAWYSVVTETVRFYRTEGTLLKISDCVYPNPITTPCFWGAVLFAVVLILAFRHASQRRIVHLLVLGTLFAWGNFAWGVRSFYQAPSGEGTSCSGVPVDSPFESSCFYGAIFFTAALIAGALYLRTLVRADRVTE